VRYLTASSLLPAAPARAARSLSARSISCRKRLPPIAEPPLANIFYTSPITGNRSSALKKRSKLADIPDILEGK
jgi:hypothetical protein